MVVSVPYRLQRRWEKLLQKVLMSRKSMVMEQIFWYEGDLRSLQIKTQAIRQG
jgi:hypothetical protein